MIIGYYPGGGGHRYYQYSNNQDFAKIDTAYDDLVNLPYCGLYLDKNGQVKNTSFNTILLHSVNYDRIYQETGRTDIVIIKSNLKKSLCREWSLKGKYRPMFFPEELSDEALLIELYQSIKDPSWPDLKNFAEYKMLPKQIYKEVEIEFNKNKTLMSRQGIYNFLIAAYTAIIWHQDLYKKYPMDPGPAQVVDVDADNTEFTEVMRRELKLYQNNKLFNFVWNVYEDLGNDAPIVTLFNESGIDNE
jgi:hypothetical protein